MKLTFFWVIFFANYGISQTGWKDFYGNIEAVKLPYKFDSTTLLNNVLLRKNDALKYLIIPATTINSEKEDSLKFSIDTASIDLYHNWSGLNLDVKDTIEIFSADGSGGLIYCSQRLELKNGLNGIIWAYHKNMGSEKGVLFDYGIEYWLFIYDINGNCIDFTQIAKKLSNYTCEQCLDYKACKIAYSNNQHLLKLEYKYESVALKNSILDIFEGTPIYQKKKKKEIWFLTQKGKFVQK